MLVSHWLKNTCKTVNVLGAHFSITDTAYVGNEVKNAPEPLLLLGDRRQCTSTCSAFCSNQVLDGISLGAPGATVNLAI